MGDAESPRFRDDRNQSKTNFPLMRVARPVAFSLAFSSFSWLTFFFAPLVITNFSHSHTCASLIIFSPLAARIEINLRLERIWRVPVSRKCLSLFRPNVFFYHWNNARMWMGKSWYSLFPFRGRKLLRRQIVINWKSKVRPVPPVLIGLFAYLGAN